MKTMTLRKREPQFEAMAPHGAQARRPERKAGPGKLLPMLAAIIALAPSAQAQQLSRTDRDMEERMLGRISADVHEFYYDAKLHGLDWDSLVRETKEKIDQTPDTTVANAEIEALLERLNDSHTFFSPPRNLATVDYGWEFNIFGNRGFVTRVRPKSDAESKGMGPGDEVLTIDGFAVDRAGAPKLKYAMNILMPRSSLQLDLRDPSGKLLHLTVAAAVKKHPPVEGLGGSSWNLNQQRIDGEKAWDKEKAKYRELGPELMVLRIPAFVQTGFDVDALFRRARAHNTLIMDLRGTPGGLEDSVLSCLGDIFDHDVKIGNWVKRNKVSTLTAKSNRRDAFRGNLIVLVDSETASGGEIFARVVQIQERGTILGDHTSGMTMEAREMVHTTGGNPIYIYCDSVTVADTVMADGKSLEHVGVQPDRVFLPSAADLAAGRDPVLAYAAELAGVKLIPEEAAKLFPPETPSE
jgi:C-terminal processing protease CtpA/Prc